MKKSAVSGIRENVSTYEGKYGKMYVHEVSFENKETHEHHTKTPKCTQFIAGQEIEYEVYMAGKSERVRPVKEPFQQNSSGGGFKRGKSPEELLFDVKKEVLVTGRACINASIEHYSGQTDITPKTIITTANMFAKFVLDLPKERGL